MKSIKTQIIMEATAELKEQIEEELEVEDPILETAEGIIQSFKKESKYGAKSTE